MRDGTLVAQRFLLLGKVGAGAMGVVYRAEDRLEGGLVALKILSESGDSDEARFARECAVLAALREPGIVGHVDHGRTESGRPFLAMEWIEGQSLSERLQGEGLRLAEAVECVRRVALAAGALHQRGIVHRDLKPGNVMLQQGDPTRPKLLDLGIARTRDTTLTLTGILVGTPGYMSPEQVKGDRDIDPRADVFALGCLLFKCLSGQTPFTADEPMAGMLKVLLEEPPRLRDLVPDAPPELDAAVALMLTKERTGRPRDGFEVARVLDGLGAMPEAPLSRQLAARGLTRSERRVACLVVGRFERPGAQAGPSHPDPALRLPSLAPLMERMRARLDLLGDGSVLVSFGELGGSANDLATRAARCALALHAAFPDMVLAVTTGTTIDTGQSMVGATIDRAAALLARRSAERGGSILLDPPSASLLETRFELQPGPEGSLLQGERATEGLRTLLGRPSPCVGRDREISFLRAWFDECESEPRARVVLLTASAGLGKSRLRHELLGRLALERPEVAVWTMRGDPIGAGSPFGLAGPMLRRSAGILDGEPVEEQRNKLRARVASLARADDVERVSDFLGEIAAVPGGSSAELGAARRDATLMGDQMRRAFADLVLAACAEHTLVVVVEDLQWGDLPSVRLLDAALLAAAERPLFVLGLGRPELHDGFPHLWEERGVQELRLEPLSKAASQRLVREALGPGLSDELLGEVIARAGGNAFFLEELVRAVSSGSTGSLPETVIGTVQARLDALPVEARRVLRAASVFGQRFPRGGVLALLGAGPSLDVELCLAELVRLETLVPRGESRFPGERDYAFRHGLVREAAYAMLTDEDRQLGHRLAAGWLEEAGESEHIVLAEHHERGGRPERAAPHWHQAARQALDGNDLDQVIERVDRAIACGADGPTLGALRVLAAEAFLWRGEVGVAESAAQQAMALVRVGAPGYCKAAEVAATAAGRRGDHGALAEVVACLLALDAEGDDAPERVRCFAQCAILLVFAGRLDSADVLLGRIDRAGTGPLGDDAAAGTVLRACAWRAIAAGDLGAYSSLMQSSAEHFTRVGDVRNACVQRVNVAYAESSVGNYERAVEGYRSVIDTAFRLGLANSVAVARHNLGLSLALLGLFADAEREETLALQAFGLQGDVRLQGMCASYLGIIATAKGDLANGERWARRALALLTTAGPPRAYALAVYARVLCAGGTIGAALELAREGHELLRKLGGVDEGEAAIRLAWAEALHAAGCVEEAEEAIREARDRLLERAARITPEHWRQSFIGRVPEHARTLELAAAWLEPAG